MAFDRTLWSLVGVRESELMSLQEIKDRRIVQLPAEAARRVELDDLEVVEVNRVLQESSAYRPVGRMQVLTLRDIVRRSRRFLPADLLIYSGDGESQVSVAVDGRPSSRHEQALNRLGGLDRLQIAVETGSEDIQTDSSILADLPQGLVATRMPLQEVNELLATAAWRSTPTTERDADQDLVISPAEAQERLDTSAVRGVATHEHRGFLLQALAEASERLLLTSPWINSGANDEFFDRLEVLLRRKPPVRVHIAYGIGQPENDRQTKQPLVERLQQLAERHSHLSFKRLRNSHAKVLIWDGTWITTSFNWMSFLGDPSRTYRVEYGTLVRSPRRIVDEEYEKWVRIIETDAGRL